MMNQTRENFFSDDAAPYPDGTSDFSNVAFCRPPSQFNMVYGFVADYNDINIPALGAAFKRNFSTYVDPDPNCGAITSYFLGDKPIGTPLVLSVTVNADATAPTSYQWYRNGIALPGEVGPVYSFTTTAEDSYASYFVVVQNPCGQDQSYQSCNI